MSEFCEIVKVVLYAIGMLILMDLITKELLSEGHCNVENREKHRENYSQCSTAKGSNVAAKIFIAV